MKPERRRDGYLEVDGLRADLLLAEFWRRSGYDETARALER